MGLCLEGKEQVMHYVIKLEAFLKTVGLEQSLTERAPSRNTANSKAGLFIWRESYQNVLDSCSKSFSMHLGQSSLPWATGRLVTIGRMKERKKKRTRDSAACNYKPSQVTPAGTPSCSLLFTCSCAS